MLLFRSLAFPPGHQKNQHLLSLVPSFSPWTSLLHIFTPDLFQPLPKCLPPPPSSKEEEEDNKPQPSAGHDTHHPRSMNTTPPEPIPAKPPELVALQVQSREPGLQKKSSLCMGLFPVLVFRQKPNTCARTQEGQGC